MMTSIAPRVIGSKHARSSRPRLPVELETMVLNAFQDLDSPQDLTWLWVGGRHVSSHFRCEIERIFRTKFLRGTLLRCNLGIRILCWDVFTSGDQGYAGCSTRGWSMKGYDRQAPLFTFDRFFDDETRAVFKCEMSKVPNVTVFRRLHEKQLVGAPVFSIQVGQVINDTGLPDLQIDDENEEVSFDWRGMLDQLMGEEHVFSTILSQRLGWHLDPGELTSNILTTHRKLARRSRLQRECRAKYRSNILDHYVHDETPALRNLQRLRLAASDAESKDRDEDLVYDRQMILDELPDNAVMYSGNSNPGPRPGSIPRGILTDRDYLAPKRDLPLPSAADLFSPRSLPDLSCGRRPIESVYKLKQIHGASHRKREREESTGTVKTKRRKVATEGSDNCFQ